MPNTQFRAFTATNAHFLIFATWIAVFGLPAGLSAAAIDIWMPRQHAPAFVQPGSNFVAEVRGPSTLPVTGWGASISNELRSWTCAVSMPTYGSIRQGKENGWRVPIAVPADAPPELFTLVLANSSGGATNRARAVKIVQNFERDFYLLQISDQHVTLDKAVEPGGNASATWGNGSTDAIRWAAPAINLINPRFVLITGDNNQIFNDVSNWCGFVEATNRVKRFHGALQNFLPPTVVMEGNHDVGFDNFQYHTEWRAAYEVLVGQRAFSYRMGSFYMLASEYPAHEDLAWARNDYNAAYRDPTLKFRLLTSHFLDSTTQVAYSTNACDLMLAGHKHNTEVYQTTPYPILLVETFQHHGKAAFFNFHRTTSGWTCAQSATHANGVNVWPLFGDWGSNPVVSVTFTRTNNGAQTSNTASIVNSLRQDFYHGRVKFLMAHGTYVASNGVVEAQYDYANGARTAVLVQTTIHSNATTTVSIRPAGRQPLGFNKSGVGWSPNGSASMTASDVLTLTDPAGAGSPGSFFYQLPQYVGGFKASFTYQAGGNRAGDGVAFCLQNDPDGWSALGGNGGYLGVGGISTSIALELNLYTGGGQVMGYAVLTNGLTGIRGGNGNYAVPGLVNLAGGNPINISVAYDSGRMTLTFSDQLAGATFTTNLLVGNLSQILGGDTAYVGFTGAYGGATAVQTIRNFSFVSIPKPMIDLDGSQVSISWPEAVEGFSLQQSRDLASHAWADVAIADNISNGQRQVTLPIGDASAFYRLVLPTP